MDKIVLTEHEQHCRAAHQQVALLRDLYDHLLLDESSAHDIPGFNAQERTRELDQDSEMLAAKLNALDLLPAPPDPEREGVLEALAKLKRTLTEGGDAGATERLIQEEEELARLCEDLTQHDRDPALAESLTRTRTALARLKSDI